MTQPQVLVPLTMRRETLKWPPRLVLVSGGIFTREDGRRVIAGLPDLECHCDVTVTRDMTVTSLSRPLME